jgi:tetratricopeptide (TPR) repeat protein
VPRRRPGADGGPRQAWWIGAATLFLCLPSVHADWGDGVDAYRRGEYARAVVEFREEVEANPGYAGAHYMMGLSYLGLERYGEAVGCLQSALDLDGSDPSYRLALGQALVKGERCQEGYGVLRRLDRGGLTLGERSTHAILMGTALTRLGRPGEAIEALARQARVDPSNADLYQALGIAYTGLGSDEAALGAFKRARQIEPYSEALARSAARTALSIARDAPPGRRRRTSYRQAAEHAESLAQLVPCFEHSLLVAESWLEAEDYERALEWLEAAAVEREHNVLLWLYRGRCHLALDDLQEALDALRRALDIGARGELRRRIYGQLAEVYVGLEDYDMAASAFYEAGNQERAEEMAALADSVERVPVRPTAGSASQPAASQ